LKYIVFAARLLIGGLFIYASIYKILDPAAFAASVRNYMIVPAQWSNLIALMLPWIEIGAGIFLIVGIQTRPSALITTGMLAVFLGAILYAYSIGLDIDCGCFSSAAGSAGRIGPLTIARDVSLLLTSFLIVIWDRGDFSIARLTTFGSRFRLLNG
jgi:putative oxidoreductase